MTESTLPVPSIPHGPALVAARVCRSLQEAVLVVNIDTHRTSLTTPKGGFMAEGLIPFDRILGEVAPFERCPVWEPLMMEARRFHCLGHVHLMVNHIQDDLQYRVDDGATSRASYGQ